MGEQVKSFRPRWGTRRGFEVDPWESSGSGNECGTSSWRARKWVSLVDHTGMYNQPGSSTQKPRARLVVFGTMTSEDGSWVVDGRWARGSVTASARAWGEVSYIACSSSKRSAPNCDPPSVRKKRRNFAVEGKALPSLRFQATRRAPWCHACIPSAGFAPPRVQQGRSS